MADIIPYTAILTPGLSQLRDAKKEGQIVVVLPSINTTHRNAIERYLQKLSLATYANSTGALTSDTTAFTAVITAINALA